MATAIISELGEISMPKEVRVGVQGEQVVLHKAPITQLDWRSMQGMVSSGPSLTKALEEEHAAELALYDAYVKGD